MGTVNIAELRDQFTKELLAAGFRKRGGCYRIPLTEGYFIVVANPVTDKELIDPQETFFALAYLLEAQGSRNKGRKKLTQRLVYITEITQQEAISKGISKLITEIIDWEIAYE